MKYVKNLIPEKYRIEMNFDKEIQNSQSKQLIQKSDLVGLNYLAASIFGILFLFNIFNRFYSGLFFLLIGLVFLPAVHNSIENALRFKFYWKIKSVLISILLIFAFVSLNGYFEQEKIVEEQNRKIEIAKAEKARLEKARIDKLEQQRKDSFEYFNSLAIGFDSKNNFTKAISNYNNALKYSKSETEINYQIAVCYSKLNKYTDAIKYFSKALTQGRNESEIYYEIALCELKLGKKQEALVHLKSSGTTKANKLREKINPIIREITGHNIYLECCDGTTSNAVGKRGACSHHGGVCKTVNEPIYREYRKY